MKLGLKNLRAFVEIYRAIENSLGGVIIVAVKRAGGVGPSRKL